jgi:hypothetical protein
MTSWALLIFEQAGTPKAGTHSTALGRLTPTEFEAIMTTPVSQAA